MKFSQNSCETFAKKNAGQRGFPFKGYKINPKIMLIIVDRKVTENTKKHTRYIQQMNQVKRYNCC